MTTEWVFLEVRVRGCSQARSRWLDRQLSRRQARIYPRQALGQAQHFVDDRITDFAVHIAKLVFGLAINRNAKWSDSQQPRLPQRHPSVLARIAAVAIVVIIRPAVGKHNQ